MHVDLTNTMLTREEVIFIGMALPMSVSCIGVHLSSNGLEYYDRIFLRTLINAKINYQFRNLAKETTTGVRSGREGIQVG